MQYGVNSNIQTQFITSADGSALSAVCFSIPLTAKQLFISSTAPTYMGLFDGDVDIATKRFPLPSTSADTGLGGPFLIPVPTGTNGQLWFVAQGAALPDSTISIMVM